MKVLVVLPDAEDYASDLRPKFPDLTFICAETYDDAAAHLDSADVLVATGVGLTPEIVTTMDRLRWIHCIISGTDQFAAARAARPDVLVTSTKGIHGTQMAEMAILHMLALSRQVVQLEANRRLHLWEAPEQRVLEGKVAVIVGLGAAGRRLAQVCQAFDMTVVGVSRSTESVGGFDRIVPRQALPEVAREADFIVLVVPSSAETRHLVGRGVLDAMKPSAFLVNLARGGVVDEEALIETLRSGGIAGAGLDVTAGEPPADDSPLWSLDSVFLTPHLAGRSDRYTERALVILESNLRSLVDDRREDLINVVSA